MLQYVFCVWLCCSIYCVCGIVTVRSDYSSVCNASSSSVLPFLHGTVIIIMLPFCSLLPHSLQSGPCPPCPKTVSVACFCRKGGVQVRRCCSRGWSCGRACRKVLPCGLHTCEEYCHEGGLNGWPGTWVVSDTFYNMLSYCWKTEEEC